MRSNESERADAPAMVFPRPAIVVRGKRTFEQRQPCGAERDVVEQRRVIRQPRAWRTRIEVGSNFFLFFSSMKDLKGMVH